MSFLIYSTTPENTDQIKVINIAEDEQSANEILRGIIISFIIDMNGRLHLKKAFVESLDVINNKSTEAGWYVVKDSSNVAIYNKTVTKEKSAGWFTDSFVSIVNVTLYKKYFITSIPKHDMIDLANSLMMSTVNPKDESNEEVKLNVELNIQFKDEQTNESVTEVVTEPVNEPTTEPITEPTPEPANESVNEPTPESTIEPANESTTEPSKSDIEAASEWATTPTDESKFLDYACHKLVNGKQCYNLSTLRNGYCSVHQPIEFSDEFSEQYDMNMVSHKVYVTSIVRKLTNLNETTFGRLPKIYGMKKLFDFLTLNRWFVELNENFREAFLNKLIQFERDVTESEKEMQKYYPQEYLDHFNDKNPDLIHKIDLNALKQYIDLM